MNTLQKNIVKNLKQVSNPQKVETFKWFFKTGKGEYGEGDVFIGITVPNLRNISKRYCNVISLSELEYFITSEIHEYRLFALLTLTYMKLDEDIYEFYIGHWGYINNWDLVDLSASKIVGKYLKDKNRSLIYEYAKSSSLWKQRISIISTHEYIRENDFHDTLAISEILVRSNQDLIQKAVGWMLREVGKRDQNVEEDFLKRYYKVMPRTMLRYAIERFDEEKRKMYLNGSIPSSI